MQGDQAGSWKKLTKSASCSLSTPLLPADRSTSPSPERSSVKCQLGRRHGRLVAWRAKQPRSRLPVPANGRASRKPRKPIPPPKHLPKAMLAPTPRPALQAPRFCPLETPCMRSLARKGHRTRGTAPNEKATVFFPSVGQKQLLLKFAKLEVIG